MNDDFIVQSDVVPFGFFNVGFGDYCVFMRNGGHESNLNDAATGSIIPSIFHMRGLNIDVLRSKMQTNEAHRKQTRHIVRTMFRHWSVIGL